MITVTQIAELFGIAGVVVTLLISIMTGSFVAGKHSNRISVLEQQHKEVAEEAKMARAEAALAAAQMAGHGATLKALEATVSTGFSELKAQLRDLAPRSRQRAGAGE